MLMFAIARVIPGDPARIALGPNATEAQVQALRHERHLDEPLPLQYWEYVRELAHGNLGNSLYSNRPVRVDIAQYLPATLELVFTAGLMIVLIGLRVRRPLRPLSRALGRQSRPDRLDHERLDPRLRLGRHSAIGLRLSLALLPDRGPA